MKWNVTHIVRGDKGQEIEVPYGRRIGSAKAIESVATALIEAAGERRAAKLGAAYPVESLRIVIEPVK